MCHTCVYHPCVYNTPLLYATQHPPLSHRQHAVVQPPPHPLGALVHLPSHPCTNTTTAAPKPPHPPHAPALYSTQTTAGWPPQGPPRCLTGPTFQASCWQTGPPTQAVNCSLGSCLWSDKWRVCRQSWRRQRKRIASGNLHRGCCGKSWLNCGGRSSGGRWMWIT